ncbi:hypothetical protein YC2023_121269 [Brassica napus]
MSGMEQVMIHSSSFLLPSIPADEASAYAIVVLNQNLPRFTPLLWEHEQQNSVFVLMEALIASTMSYLSSSLTKTLSSSVTEVVLRMYVNVFRYKPDVIKGDMDSIRPDVLNFYGTKVIDESHDQDTTDLDKCILFIRDSTLNQESCRLQILATGALGGRFDHEAGNLNVLYRYPDTRIILLSDDCLIQLLPKTHRHEIRVQPSLQGPHCGLIPIGAPSAKTTTTGLQWDLNDTEMRFGGLVSTSNMVKGEKITVESDSDLLWTISIKKQDSPRP